VRARRGDPAVPPRSQPSIAVSADGERWSILNASPDIRDQLARFPGLHPRPGTRDIPLDSVLITNADLDHTLGLLILRESLPFRVVSTRWIRDALLEHNAAFRLLAPAFGVAGLDESIALDRAGALEARFFPVPGKVPTYLADCVENHRESTLGVRITDTRSGRRLVYVPGVRSLAGTQAELEAAACSFVDGTFFRADELRAARPGAPDAVAMGHQPVGGPGGSLEVLEKLGGRRLYIHINNTNPMLDADSEEAAEVSRAGVEIAADGMEFEV
jgi:pyrroloquinoline quinone biosynthesis protein B